MMTLSKTLRCFATVFFLRPFLEKPCSGFFRKTGWHLLIAFSLVGTLAQQAVCQRPNILVIELDDARYDMFQPNGGPSFFNTPAINRIANEGVNFKYMGATTSLCAPSRASIYTGLYSHHHGTLDNGTSPKAGLTYVSSILQNAGYYTGFVGKWLIGDKIPDTPTGFDYWAITDDDEHIDPPVRFNNGTTVNYEGHDAVIYTDIAMNFLQNMVPSGDPWMLFLFHRVPHLPYQPLAADDTLYQHATIAFPDNFPPYEDNFPSYLYPGHFYEGDSTSLDQDIRDYYETCHAAEYSVARILNYLDSNNLLDNTLVVFSSDNGFFLGEHDLSKKSLAYDEALRVPLFIRYPEWFTPGTIIDDEFAANIDIAPTILEAAGIPDTFNMDGVSLHQLAEGQVHRKDFFFEHYSSNGNNWEAVRSLDYAYIYSYCSSTTEEFFDLSLDPQQNNNLVFNAAYASLIQQYRIKRDSLRMITNDTIYPALQNCSLHSTFYRDEDVDGYGNPAILLRASIIPEGYVSDNTDCNDSPSSGGATVYPGAPESENGIDDDCDGLIDEFSIFYADADADGFGNPDINLLSIAPPAGFVSDSTDCNDDPAQGGSAVYPGATEIANGIDDDCNGLTDEVLLYADADQDGYGNALIFVEGYDSLEGYVADDTDCNDNPAAGGANIHPNATDVCNYIDDNCNGQTDENGIIATITPSGVVSVCTSTDVTFTANNGAGITFQWLKNGVNIAGATGSTYTINKKGDYKVTETNSYGCISTSLATTLSTMSKPEAIITPSGNLDICSAGSVLLKANTGTGFTYKWKKGFNYISGATKKNYTATIAATYKVEVTKTNGCSKMSAGVIVTNSCRNSGAEKTTGDGELVCYPNPASENFTIYLPAAISENQPDETALVEVVDILGTVVHTQQVIMPNGGLFSEITLTPETANGMYLIRIKMKNQNYYKQIMIQR